MCAVNVILMIMRTKRFDVFQAVRGKTPKLKFHIWYVIE